MRADTSQAHAIEGDGVAEHVGPEPLARWQCRVEELLQTSELEPVVTLHTQTPAHPTNGECPLKSWSLPWSRAYGLRDRRDGVEGPPTAIEMKVFELRIALVVGSDSRPSLFRFGLGLHKARET
jgi:hypothetical protein